MNRQRTPPILAATLGALCACAGPRPPPAPPLPAASVLAESVRPWADWMQRCDLERAQRTMEDHLARLPLEKHSQRQRSLLGLGLLHLMRGRFGEDARMFWQAVRADPAAPLARVAAWQLDESLAVAGLVNDELRAEMERLLAEGPPPELRFLLHRTLRSWALRRGDWAAAATHVRQAGAVLAWRATALNARDPGVALLDMLRDPERAFSGAAWRSHPVSEADGLLWHEQEGARGLWLAESFFRVEGAARLWLRIEGPGDWAAMVDRALIRHGGGEDRGGTVEAHWISVLPGTHRLRVAVPIENGRALLGVNLLPADGRATPPVFAPGPPEGGESLAADATVEPDPTLEPPETADPIERLWAGLLDWSRGDLDGAHEQIFRLRQQLPAFSLAHYLEGVLWFESSELPAGIAAAQARRLWGQALSDCPALDLARFRLALLDGMEGREETALEAMRRLEAEHPDSFIFPFTMANFFDRLGWNAEADAALERAARRVEFDPDLWNLQFSRAVRSRNETLASALAGAAAARPILGRALNAYFWSRGQRDAARRGMDAAIARFGSQIGPRLEAIDAEMAAGEHSRARELLDRAEKDFGPRPEWVQRRLHLADRLGRPDEARRELERWIELLPWDLQLRLAWRAVTGRDSLFSAGDGPADPRPILKEYQDSDFMPGGDAVLVLDQADLEIASDGSSIERVHLLVHVLTATGVERWGEVRDIPPAAQVERVRSLDAEGNAREAEIIPGKDSISIPALQAGEYVEIAYRIGRPPNGVRAGGFSAGRFYFASEGLPIFRSRYTIRIPRGLALVTRQHNGAPSPTRQREGGFDVVRFERSRTLAIPAEPDASPLDESAPFVEAGLAIDWRDLRDRLDSELSRASRPDWSVAQFAARHDAAQAPASERVCRLFRAVGNAVRRGGEADDFGEGAASILLRGEGNRLTALVAVLRAAGFDPMVYLARTVSSPAMEYRFPQDGVFTHGVVAVPVENQRTLWLDPMERNHPCDRLYAYLWDQPALRLRNGPAEATTIRLPPAPRVLPGKEIHLQLELAADGSLSGSGRDTLDTSEAAKAREILSGFSMAQRQLVMENGLSAAFPGARLESWSMESIEDPDRPLVLQYRLHSAELAERLPDQLVLRGGFFPYRLAAGLAAQAQRHRPLLIEDETRLRTVVEIRLPPGAPAPGPPPN
jgi:tetratricopeptide (TPR) repeat protein